MKGFFIEITNNLLDPKHRKKMGTAVWEFMWCLDKITRIDENQIGWVLGGKPINLKDIKKEIGITESKISKNLNKLEKEGYLNIKHAAYGLIISVNKAKKRFAKKDMEVCPKGQSRFSLKGKPNKTIQLDNTINIINIKRETFKPPSLEEVRNYCLERKNNIDPEQFIYFYESKGWMIGKNKMKDWRAAVRTWEKRSNQKVGGNETAYIPEYAKQFKNKNNKNMEKVKFNLKENEKFKEGRTDFKKGKIKNKGVGFGWYKIKVPVKEWNNYYSFFKGSYSYLGGEGNEVWIGFLAVEKPLNALKITDLEDLRKIQSHYEAIKHYPQPMEVKK